MYKRFCRGVKVISRSLIATESNQNSKMKLIAVVALALVAAAAAAPAGVVAPEPVKILRFDNEHTPDGGYAYAIETEDGIKKDETGELKTVNDEDNKPHEVVVVRGSFSYLGPDGTPILITYYADETGFHAEGDSIPKENAVRR